MQLFSILVVPALLIPLAIRCGWRKACYGAATPFLCALAILGVTHKQSSQVGWITRISLSSAVRQCGQTLAVQVVWVLVLIVAVGAVAGIARKNLDALWVTLLIATVLPPLVLWAASEVTNPVFLMRYAVFFVPAFAGLLGASVGMLLELVPGVALRLCVAAVIVLGVVANSYPNLDNVLRLRSGADSTATLTDELAKKVHVGDTVIYEASHAAGGQIYGWSLYGHDTSLQRDLLEQLPHGAGAMLQERKVVNLNPFTTQATSSISPTTWVISSSGKSGPRPELEGCRAQRRTLIARVPVVRMACAK